MTENSKFIRNRINKLIGKPREQKENLHRPQKTKPKCQSEPVTLFKDYTYLRLQAQKGLNYHNYHFRCFYDEKIFNNYVFPKGTLFHHNDEDSPMSHVR